jgi:trehalose 6-phosphate phosphatase
MTEDTLAERWALLLDFDGTLIEIAEEPGAIVVPDGLGNLLQRLKGRLGGALALVSGRAMADIDGFLTPHCFDAAGLYGAEQRIGDIIDPQSRQAADRLRPAVARLSRLLADKEGVQIEDKGCAVAVHWRKAPHLEPLVTDLVESVIYDLAQGFRMQLGKAVAEIAPADASKGRAIKTILAAPAYRERRPIFIGDDLADRSGFEIVTERGGIAVQVGAGAATPYWLPDPVAVRSRLESWAAGMPIDPERDFTA